MTLRIGDTGNWQLPALVLRSQQIRITVIQGVDPRVGDMVSHRLSMLMSLLLLTSVTLTVTPRIDDTGSQQLPASVLQKVVDFPRFRISVITGVDDSTYWWYGASSTLRDDVPAITQMGYCYSYWYGELTSPHRNWKSRKWTIERLGSMRINWAVSG